MRQMWLGLVLAGTLLFSAACSQNAEDAAGESKSSAVMGSGVSAKDAYHRITAEEAKKKMDAGGVVIVDVRTAAEYEEKHIPSAVLVPNESIGGTPVEQLPDLDAVLLVYCRTGVRSKAASEKLAALGYRKIYDFGGIVDWPYETEAGKP